MGLLPIGYFKLYKLGLRHFSMPIASRKKIQFERFQNAYHHPLKRILIITLVLRMCGICFTVSFGIHSHIEAGVSVTDTFPIHYIITYLWYDNNKH